MDKIDGMRAFVAAVETGSFTAAGARLGISNKLVSKYIVTLEKQLGATLLHRTTRTLSLTDPGERYLGGARKVLASLAEAETDLRGVEGLAGRLRVAAPLTFGEGFVTHATRAFLAQHPNVAVDLHLSDQMVDLAQGGFDLAVRIGNLRDSALRSRRLGETQMRVVASPKYLRERGVPRHPDDLRRHACIRDTNAATYNHWRFEIDGQHVRIPVAGSFAANSAPACLVLARAGDGVFICPDIFLKDDLQQGTLVQVLEGFPSGSVTIQVVRLPSQFSNEVARTYTAHLSRAFQQI